MKIIKLTFFLIVLFLLYPANSEAATLRQVENGTTTISSDSGSNTATLSTTLLDTTKAFMTFNYSVNNANPGCSSIMGVITNTSTLTFSRISSTGCPAVTVEWYVSEFTAGVTVQRGTLAGNSNIPFSEDVTITSVTTSTAFVILSNKMPPSTYGSDDFMKSELTANTTLNISGEDSDPSALTAWQVVEFTDSSVQFGTISLGSGVSSGTFTLSPAVDTAKTWIIMDFSTLSGTGSNIGQKSLRLVLTNSTTVTVSRQQTGQAMVAHIYAVEFTDNTTVQHDVVAFGTGDTTINETINAIDQTTTIVTGGGFYGTGGDNNYTADDNPGTGAHAQLNLTSTTNLAVTRALTGSVTANVGYFVVDFSPAVAPVAPVKVRGGVKIRGGVKFR